MNRRNVITIDGNAGSGKTTLARLLAERLGYAHLNSGLLYRAVALLAKRSNVNISDPKALAALAKTHNIELRYNKERGAILFVDNEDVTKLVQAPEISEATSKLAAFSEVREVLLPAQRNAFLGSNIVAEGRDMGTVVFPDAPIKFFVTVSPQIRVQRRIAQLYGDISGLATAEQSEIRAKIEVEVLERDKRDLAREHSPTKPAPDAIHIDNSAKTLTEVVESMYHITANRDERN